jgi:hypothetical protein
MMDSTADFPLRERRWHFSPPPPVPQGLVRLGAACHKPVGERLEALENPVPGPPSPRAGHELAMRHRGSHVGVAEVSVSGVTSVSNHPQSLWISLWTGIRRHRQVTQAKDFSFFRSIFERPCFSSIIKTLDLLSLWSPERHADAIRRLWSGKATVDRRSRPPR